MTATPSTAISAKFAMDTHLIHKVLANNIQVILRHIDTVVAQGEEHDKQAAKHLLEHIGLYGAYLHHHHYHEEEIVFPVFKERLPELMATLDKLASDHAELVNDLKTIETLTKPDSTKTDTDLQVLGQLAPVLRRVSDFIGPHFKIEEDTFTVEALSTKVTYEDLHDIEKKIMANIRADPHAPVFFAFLVYTLDAKDLHAIIGQTPWILRKIIFPYVWRGKYKNYIPFYPLSVPTP